MVAPEPVSPLRVELGGVALALLDGRDYGWTFSEGVAPVVRDFETTRIRAEEIERRFAGQFATNTGTTTTSALDLVVEVNGERTLHVERLVFLGLFPGSDAGGRYRRVRVADRRILLQTEAVEASYNVRRKTGDLRLVSGELVPLEVAQEVEDVAYRSSTLNNGKPYKAREVLEDVLGRLVPRGYRIEGVGLQDSIEGLELRDPGPAALARVLAFLPGLGITCAPDGDLVTFSKLSGELLELEKIPHLRYSAEEWRVVSKAALRPKRVHVYRPREIEVRWDYTEAETTFSANTGTVVRTFERDDENEDPFLENVAPCPDGTLTLATGRTVLQGEWVRIDELLDAWNKAADYPACGPLTQEVIRKHYFRPSELHGVYTMTPGAPDLVWSRRIATIMEHWRRSYRITRGWVSKLRAIKAQRVALIDPETGTRGRAQVWCDYVVKPSARGLASRGVNYQGWEVEGYADDLSNARPSPFEVEVLDSDLGIFRVTPRVDLFGQGTQIAPGETSDGIPVTSAGSAFVAWASTGLASGFKLSVVLSAIQDSPNNLGRLHKRTVDLEDAVATLPEAPEVGDANGPDWHVIDTLESARFAWIDDDRDAILQAVREGQEPPETLLVNPETVEAASLATVARVAVALLDRAEGVAAGRLAPDLRVRGSIARVDHSVVYQDPATISAATRVAMPPVRPESNPFAFMPEAVRRVLKGLVE